MVARGHNFFQVFLHQIPGLDMVYGKGGKPYNGVHGSADVMGHIGQKDALRLIGPVRLLKGIFQQRLLFHLNFHFLIHAAEPQDNSLILAPFACAHGFCLVVLYLPVSAHPEIYKINFLFRKFLFQVFSG